MYNEHYCVRNAFCFSCWPKINIPSARSQCQAQFSPSPRTYIEQKCILLFWLFFSFCQIRQIHASQASACFIEFNFNSHTRTTYTFFRISTRIFLSAFFWACMNVWACVCDNCCRSISSLSRNLQFFLPLPIYGISVNLLRGINVVTAGPCDSAGWVNEWKVI